MVRGNVLEVILGESAAPSPAAVHHLVIAGWTGRDRVAQQNHMAELEKLGVARPSRVPVYYRVAASRATTAEVIEVSGGDSSGEVEIVLLETNGHLWVGVGSDHTDRKAEAYSITLSKQLCEKPVSREWWLFEDVADHWDSLVLRSWAVNGQSRERYQEGAAAHMLAARDLIRGYTNQGALAEDTLMFCGTLPAIGGIRPAARFEMELEDPVRGRKLHHQYDVRELPVEG